MAERSRSGKREVQKKVTASKRGKVCDRGTKDMSEAV